MKDIDPALVKPPYQEKTLQLHGDASRKVYWNDVEVPFPEGKLIVSRTDTNGVITHCNQAFVDMSGYTREELIGQPQNILRHPDVSKAAYADLWKTLQEGRKWQGYLKNLRKDGSFYNVLAVVVPNLRDGEVVGYSSVRRRPSRRKMDEALQLYAEQIKTETPAS